MIAVFSKKNISLVSLIVIGLVVLSFGVYGSSKKENPPTRAAAPASSQPSTLAANTAPPAPLQTASRTAGATLQTWVAGFQDYGTGSNSATTPTADAQNFNVIVKNIGGLSPTIAAQMRQANPRLKLLVYMNGCCSVVGKNPVDFTNYPDAYAYSTLTTPLSSQYKVLSGDNYPEMNRDLSSAYNDNTQNPWPQSLATTCATWVAQNSLDGCFYDSYSWGWFENSNSSGTQPRNPATGNPWLQSEYDTAGQQMLANVRSYVQSKDHMSPVIALNGLQSGNHFSGNEGMLPGTDMAMAEDFLVNPSWPAGQFDIGSDWQNDLNMEITMVNLNKTLLTTVKSWTPGTAQQKNTLNQYAMATILLGGNTNTYLNFQNEHSVYGGDQYYAIWNAPIGSASGAYFCSNASSSSPGGTCYQSNTCYVRNYTSGVVVLNANTNGSGCSYNLGGNYTNLESATVTTATLAADTADVYVKADSSTTATCPSGQTGTPPNCVTATCPSGQTGTPPNCVSSPPGCTSCSTGSDKGSGGNSGSSTTIQATGLTTQLGLPAGINPANVASVTYTLDGKLLAYVTRTPFTYNLNTAQLKDGCHTLTTSVLSKDGTKNVSSKQLCVHHPIKWYAHTALNILGSLLVICGGFAALLVCKPLWRKKLSERLNRIPFVSKIVSKVKAVLPTPTKTHISSQHIETTVIKPTRPEDKH